MANSFKTSDPDMFDVGASLRKLRIAVRAHKITVLVTAVITLALIQLYVHVWPPVYEAEATLMAEQAVDTQRDAFYVNWDVFRKDDPRTEIQLITSGSILNEVIKREHLKYDDVYHPPLTEIGYLWETSWPGRKYLQIKEHFLPPDPEAPKGAEKDLGRTLSDLNAAIKVAPVGDTSIGKLTMKGPTRRVSQIANTLLTVYLADREKRHEEEARRAVNVLGVALDQASHDLETADHKRVDYANQHHLVFNMQKEVAEAKDLNDLESDIDKSQAKAATMAANLRQVEAELATQPESRNVAKSVELNTIREATKMKRMELQATLAGLTGRYQEDSPEIQEVRADIARLDALIASEPEKIERSSTEGINTVRQQLLLNQASIEAELQGERAGLSQMQSTAAALRDGLTDVPEMEQKLRDLDRDFQMAQETYQALKLKRAEALVSLTTVKTAMPSLRVVDYAMPPGGKSWPKLKYLYPGGLLAGLLIGILAAMIKAGMEGRVFVEDLIESRDIPLLAVVDREVSVPVLSLVHRQDAEKSAGAGVK